MRRQETAFVGSADGGAEIGGDEVEVRTGVLGDVLRQHRERMENGEEIGLAIGTFCKGDEIYDERNLSKIWHQDVWKIKVYKYLD